MAFPSLKLPSRTKEEIKIGAQGLKKCILQVGDSWKTPFPGDHVQVHYSGRVDGGEALDSSRDRGVPFTFKLGSGEVIKGWDEGIATMRKGERAIFTIPPNLAYGEAGSPPLIAPNSTLIFDVVLLSWNTVRDLSGDGGILKKIIREGEGWSTPREADEVLVKYEARLDDGTIISKSDEGLEFHINEGFLCPAISIAAKTMRKGEKVELSVKFSYGIEKSGNKTTRSGFQVPLNSNLTVDLELISWKSVVDVTGDNKVVKKIVREGEGYDCPSEGSTVKVKYTGKLEDGTIFERKGIDEEPIEFTCFEEQVLEGLDRAIMSMRKGEIALVTINSDYGFGNEECHRHLAVVTPNATLFYEVELLSFTKDKEFWKMETPEKFEACQRKKDDGNKFFKARKFWRASKKYEKAAKYVEYDHSFTNEEKIQATSLKISCNLNNAACKLKLQDYSEASRLCTKNLKVQFGPLRVVSVQKQWAFLIAKRFVFDMHAGITQRVGLPEFWTSPSTYRGHLHNLDVLHTSQVLDIDPHNVKALYRRSQSYVGTSDFEKAEVDIKKLLSIDPNNRDAKIEYRKLKEKQKEYDRNQSTFFSAMVSRIGQLEI